MKISKVAALLSAFLLIFSISSPARATNDPNTPSVAGGKLELYGVTLEWDPEAMWFPVGCSKFDFSYRNNSGMELLRVGMDLTSQYGDSITWDSEIGIDSGVFGTWNRQICDFDLGDGLGPYKMKLSIKDYSGSERSVTSDFMFKARPAIVKNVRAIPSTTSASIAWDKLGVAESYEIRITYNNNSKAFGAWKTVDKYYNLFKWTGLKRKTNYSVQVRALTNYGYGAESTVKFRTK